MRQALVLAACLAVLTAPVAFAAALPTGSAPVHTGGATTAWSTGTAVLALAMQEPAPQPAPQKDVQPAPEKDVKVNVDVHRGSGLAVSPVWIAIGVIALVLLVLLVAMAARGGGSSTVVK